MTFTSLSFLVFIVIIFFLYYFPLKENTKAQNWLLLLSSYFFYGLVDWKMVPLLLAATLITFFIGIVVHKSKSLKKSSLLTTLGVVISLGLLVYFKYFNFFIDSFASLFKGIGLNANIRTFNIILPIGISFFTFKLISYIVEIHKGKIEATKDFVVFFTYISFFPTILSGPIDRPNTFIPQLERKRSFDYKTVVDGFRQILWGLFQKVVIADNLAGVVNHVWADLSVQTGSVYIITAILVSIQLYADFAGYSNMAIGIGKLLGFEITKNFNYPFFSRSIPEFWRKWHISLTSWLTNYVFMPLNIKFRNLDNYGLMLAILINMIVVGIWHGANWKYFMFGLYNGLLFIPLIISGSMFKKSKLKVNKYGIPSLVDVFKIITTFLLITIGLIFYSADSIRQAGQYISGIFSVSAFSMNGLFGSGLELAKTPIVFAIFMFAIEWIYRDYEYPLAQLGIKWKWPIRYALYYLIIFAIFWYKGSAEQFIYTQF